MKRWIETNSISLEGVGKLEASPSLSAYKNNVFGKKKEVPIWNGKFVFEDFYKDPRLFRLLKGELKDGQKRHVSPPAAKIFIPGIGLSTIPIFYFDSFISQLLLGYLTAFSYVGVLVGKDHHNKKSINKLQPDNISTYNSNFKYSVADTLDDVEALTGKENVVSEFKKKFPYEIKEFKMSIKGRKCVMEPDDVDVAVGFHAKGEIPIELDRFHLVSYLNTDGWFTYSLEAGQEKPIVSLSVEREPKIIIKLDGEGLISDIPKLKKLGKLDSFSVNPSKRKIECIDDIINANIRLSTSIPQTDREKEAIVNDIDKLIDVFGVYYVNQ